MQHTPEDAKLILNSFFDEMNSWGNYAINNFNPESNNFKEVQDNLKERLKKIFDKYLTDRTRKTGRIESMQFSLGNPDYDSATESIESIVQEKSSFILTTKKIYPNDNYHENYRYKIKSTNNSLLIDSKERYSEFEKKWIKDII